MSYEFKKLSEVEALTEVPEGATVLAEVGGAIKRIPGSGLGGDKVLKIVRSDFSDYLSGVSTAEMEMTYEANMTLEEARAAFSTCELDGVWFYASGKMLTIYEMTYFYGNTTGMYFEFVYYMGGDLHFIYWTEDYGITGYYPYGDAN